MTWFVRLLAIGVAGLVAFTVAAVLVSGPEGGAEPHRYSHELLEADRVMTERMAVDVAPAMLLRMRGQGMWERSADPAYLRALEDHTRRVDRMLGRLP